ncbi:hypothetical protein ASC95_19970 [Pelomonas sp. Root1217]|uniref:DUF3422 family protein n=1 Tax=Pelomonas sp. Root1217 TaxID=1736430 RepID=UPI00070F301E|nr:DUF3422 domain-containing protein [Pelomonas sp. Root1217]KQV48891.1 hypothetical protein ASC95_19970 [Pelomonas sp. Root1217]
MHEDSLLPPDDALRLALHNEVHARPPARIRLPAVIVHIAVLNDGISRALEHAHLRQLPGQHELAEEALNANFLRLRCGEFSLKWERHAEFTRYSVVQPLPADAEASAQTLDALALRVAPDWLGRIPGRTFAAIKLVMIERQLTFAPSALTEAQTWFGAHATVASTMGGGHSLVVTDFCLRATGFEHIVVLAEPGTPETRAGRICQRLLELETYRLMALRGLPAAKSLGSTLAEVEATLASITARLEKRGASEAELLDDLISTAARIEHATASHQYRFAATQAYQAIVEQRLAELHEGKVAGRQSLGEFMQRRLSPAIATVNATAQRLAGLSQRISRASALLRTRVDIATEAQNQQLLAQLGEGQRTQLRMQATVEGLSLAAITYYVVSLLLYFFKALKAEGWLPFSPELAAGAAIPLVLLAVWQTTRRIHRKIFNH